MGISRVISNYKISVLLLSIVFVSVATIPNAIADTFPGTNGTICFESDRDGNSEIYTMDGSGGSLTRITNNGVSDAFCAMSPDGTKIVYTSSGQITIANADGTGTPTTLVSGSSPSWSPDGAKITFSKTGTGGADDIFVINADGTNETQLTFTNEDERGPSYSPDGTKIAVSKDVDGSTSTPNDYDIVVISATTGSVLTQVTSNSVFDSEPNWSPDGAKIAYGSSGDVLQSNSDGTGGTINLTNSVGVTDFHASYSPDGTKIAFMSNTSGNFDIVVMDSNGANPTIIGSSSVRDASPNWGPATVAVPDTEDPVLTVPDDIAVNTDPGLPTAVVAYAAPSATDNVAVASIVQTVGLSSGSAFPVGVTTNTFVATDTSGNTDTKSFTVTVTDNEPPTVNTPPNLTVNTDPDLPTATNIPFGTLNPRTDNVGVVSTTFDGPFEPYPIGDTTVFWTVSDAAGNTAQTTGTTVTVVDNQPPDFDTFATQTITLEHGEDETSSGNAGTPTATDNSGLAVTIGTPVDDPVTEYCSGDPLVCTNGQTIREITRTWTATDAFGNAAQLVQTITVEDTLNPGPTISGQATNGDSENPVNIDNSNAFFTTETSISIPFDATDEGGDGVDDTNDGIGIDRFECRLDFATSGIDYATCTNPFTASGLADGLHFFEVRAIDEAGNIESTGTYSWNVDTTPPTIILPSQLIVETAVITANADGTIIDVDRTGTNIINEDSAGSASFTVEATKTAGVDVIYSLITNDSPVGSGVVSLGCDGPQGGGSNNIAASEAASLDVPEQTFSYDGTSPTTTTVTCEAEDAVGNSDSKQFTVTVDDTTAPLLFVPVSINAQTADLIFVDTDPTTTDGTTDPQLSNADFSETSAGSKTFDIEAVKPQGNDIDYTARAFDLVNVTQFSCDGPVDGASDPSVPNTNAEVNEIDETFPISDMKSETTTVTCVASDGAGNDSDLAPDDTDGGTTDKFDITIQDTTAPIVLAPADITVDATGVYTPVNIDIGTGSGPGGVYVADLVSTGAIIIPTDTRTEGAGEILVDDNRTPSFTECDSTDPCFESLPDTTVTWFATDDADNTSSDDQIITVNPTQLEIGWLRTSGGVVTPVTPVETQIESSEQLFVKDYRGNVDRTNRDTLTFTTTSPTDTSNGGSGITTTLIETAPDSAEFVHPVPIIFTALGTSETIDLDGLENDALLVNSPEDATALFQSPAIVSVNPTRLGEAVPQRSEISSLDDSITAIASIIDVNSQGAVASSTDPGPILNSDAYIIETTGSASVFDPAFVNGVVDTRFGIGTYFNEAGEFVISPLQEASDGNGNVVNDGLFHTTISATFSSGPTDFNARVLHVDPNDPNNDEVEFLYNVPSPPPRDRATIFNPPDGSIPLTNNGVNVDARSNCELDTDGDALCDNWELPGQGLLVNGTYFLACIPGNTIVQDPTGATVCPDPLRKDIYVEIDYMTQNHEPDARAIADVVKAFHEARVFNPGGNAGQDPTVQRGIALHVIVDEDMSQTPSPFAAHVDLMPYSEFLDRKEFFFGTPSERAASNAADLLTAKRQAFHYNMWSHSQAGNPGSSGIGEVGGNDFIVSMGDFAGHRGTSSEQAATFMHELGHNLSLEHGGGPGNVINCKPNYLSIMNYAFQFNTLVNDRPLDYSRQARPTIFANNLIEANGIQWQYRPLFNEFNPPFSSTPPPNFPSGTTATLLKTVFAGPNGEPVVVPTGNNIDWNQDHTIQGSNTPVSVDVTNLDLSGCGPAGTAALTGYDDWSNIDFNFRDSDVFASGAQQDLTEPSRADIASQIAHELNPIRKAIRELPDDVPPSTCKSDLETREAALRNEIKQALKTIGNLELDTIAGIQALKAEVIDGTPCQGIDTGNISTAAGDTQTEFEESAKISVPIFVKDDTNTIDVSKNGVVNVIILGLTQFETEGFAVDQILLDTVRLGKGDGTGAQIAHQHGNPSFFTSHFQDINGDGTQDLRLHFRQNETQLSPSNDPQNVCVTGKISRIIAGTPVITPFDGCQLMNVIRSQDDAPTLTITTTSGSVLQVNEGTTVDLTATASDTEDGNLSGSIIWTKDGVELVDEDSSSSGVQVTLPIGTHIVTASVTDSAGQTTTATLTISVSTPIPTNAMFPTISYSGTGGKDNNKHLVITAAITSPSSPTDILVANANVSITLNLPDGGTQSFNGITGTDGTIEFLFNNAPTGSYTTTVTSLTASGFSWDGITVNDPGYTK